MASRSPLHLDAFLNKSEDIIENDASSSSWYHYWEPHSASIDFCESNYLHSPYVVETHNTYSSLLGISLFGLVGMLHGNPTREWRTTVVYFILTLVGFGSTALHGTLHWAFQSCDELPMIYLVVAAAYCCLEVATPKGRPYYPYLPPGLLVLCAINTVIYYVYQRFFVVFMGTFVLMLAVLVVFHVRIAWGLFKELKLQPTEGQRSKNNKSMALQFYIWHHLAFAVIASPVWFLDQFGCSTLRPYYDALPWIFRGMTLHVVWHFCSGFASYCLIQFLCLTRADVLGIECSMQRVWGILPVAGVMAEEEQDKSVSHLSKKKE